MLKTRADILILNYPSASKHADCMLLFTNMVAQTTVLYLCEIMESMTWQTDEHRNATMEFKRRSLVAAQEIVSLTRSLAHLSYFKVRLPLSLARSPFPPSHLPRSLSLCLSFIPPNTPTIPTTHTKPQLNLPKVHPFTPLPLVICAEFFNTHRYLDKSVDMQVREVLEALRDLSSVNNIALEYLSGWDLEES